MTGNTGGQTVTDLRTVLWRGLYLPGAEYCTLRHGSEGMTLEGTALLAADQRPYAVSYRIRCDRAWNTRLVEVRSRSGADDGPAVTLAVEHDQRWWRGRD